MTTEDIQTVIAPVLRKYDVKHASLFGSVARHEDTPASDVDLVVEFGTTPGLIAYSRLARELEEVLGKPVDLLTMASINKHVLPFVARDLTPIYEA